MYTPGSAKLKVYAVFYQKTIYSVYIDLYSRVVSIF
jgi:hypothetical protein